MHASRWLLGISAVALVTAGGMAVGCSSSSSPQQPAEDASTESGGGGEDAASNNCHVDASLQAFAASDAAGAGCAACVQGMCATAISMCSSSCPCINLFQCLADAGVTAANLAANTGSFSACTGGISSAAMLLQDPGISAITTCLSGTCSTECAGLLPVSEAGTSDDGGGSTEAGGSTDGGATTADAGDGG